MSRPICPYCNEESVLGDSAKIYGRSYGPLYLCWNYPQCDAYVGCHPGTTTPLGRLANRELREAKKRAHAAFDPIWRLRVERDGWHKGGARRWAYRWLAKQMRIPEDDCHIGMFTVEQCALVVTLSTEYFAKTLKGPQV
jgi:hypothetical protein